MAVDRRIVLGGAAAFLAAGGGAAWWWSQRGSAGGGNEMAQKLLEPQALPDMVMGDANAPVTIIEYASMTCGHCANFHKNTLPQLKERYIDTGKVRMILREFPFDPRSAAAFMLARCAPQDKYYPMVSVLFEQQSVWAQAQDPRPAMLQLAKLAGFTQESFDACLSNQELLDKVSAVFEKASKEYGVESTPTFFINGEKVTGAMPIDEMAPYIEKHL